MTRTLTWLRLSIPALFLSVTVLLPFGVLLMKASELDPSLLPLIVDPALGSLIIATATATLGTLLAAACASAAQSLGPWLRRSADIAVMLPLLVPPHTVAAVLDEVFGRAVHGTSGMIGALIVSCFPLPYALFRMVLRGTDPRLVDAAQLAGTSPGALFRLLALPRLLRVAPAAAVFFFVTALSDPSVPSVLGGRTQTLAHAALLQVTAWGEGGVAAALGVALFLPSLAAVVMLLRRSQVGWSDLQSWIDAGTSVRLPLGGSGHILLARLLLGAYTAGVLLVVTTAVLGAVDAIGDGTPIAGLGALASTLSHAGIGALIALGLGLSTAWAAEHWPGAARMIDAVQAAVLLFPGAMLGIAFALSYGVNGPAALPILTGATSLLNGSIAITAMYAVVAVPVVHLALRAAAAQVPADALDVARVVASDFSRIRRNVLSPYMAWIAVPAVAAVLARTVVAVVPVVFVTSPDVPLVVSRTLDDLDHAQAGPAFILALVTAAVTAAAVAVVLAGLRVRQSILGRTSQSRRGES